MPVDVLGYTLDRVRAALRLARDLEASEFPQPNCKEGIQIIARWFEEREEFLKKELLKGVRDLKIVQAACRGTLDDLFDFLPVLGFLLRSTNVRNAFELHGPLARLAEKLVPGAKLVISSEWNFSPHSFTYPSVNSILANYVLIGLPASESDNGLVLPLAGHELGHAVWAHQSLGKQFDPRVTQALLKEIQGQWDEYQRHFTQVKGIAPDALESDMYARRTWAPAQRWATLQIEEYFCDQLGVRVFGEAFLHAFAYLLAPGPTARNLEYPSNQRRAENLVAACERWKFPVPDGYVSSFQDETSSLQGSNALLCSLADRAADTLTKDLLEKCNKIGEAAAIPLHDQQEVAKITAAFRKLIPGAGSRSLSSIMNAGWEAFRDPDLWSNYPHIQERKADILKALVLKTVEVFEIEARLSEAGNAT